MSLGGMKLRTSISVSLGGLEDRHLLGCVFPERIARTPRRSLCAWRSVDDHAGRFTEARLPGSDGAEVEAQRFGEWPRSTVK